MTSFQSYDVMLHTMSSALPEKIDPPQPGQNRFYIFTRFRLDGAFTLRSRVNFAHCDFWLFFLDWRSRWHDGNLPGSGTSQKPKVISELNAIPALQVWLRQLEMCVASELRDVLWRIAKVWWRYVHWFPFYMTGDRTFGLALVRQTRRQRIEHCVRVEPGSTNVRASNPRPVHLECVASHHPLCNHIPAGDFFFFFLLCCPNAIFFRRAKFGSLSPRKTSCDRVALPNLN